MPSRGFRRQRYQGETLPSLISYVRDIFGKLDENHFKVLRVIEQNLARYEIVPREVIYSETGLGERAEKLLKKLNEYKLIWAPMGYEKGFCINYYGLDMLALKALVDRNIITSLGRPLGVGKEADVYDALAPDGKRLVVKFFRIGRTSFRKYERHRTSLVTAPSHLAASIKSARMEYRALRMLHPAGIKVPKPVARNRHVIVTEFFQGIELAIIQSLSRPIEVLGEILRNAVRAWEVGVVHSDLSAYNILITPEEEILIIDWPQWVPPSHPMAREYLRRDLSNLIKFFRRKWRIEEIPEEYLDLIRKVLEESFLI
ncbi:MAG: AarF/UbiB family protein [Aigarchaeota archaeon]|nr:AarF/UbiB family protein [Candidatus Wolframiiraptor gerlachensis]